MAQDIIQGKNVKKRVSVITLHSSVNYGSVLQTYATKKVFEKMDCTVEFVDYTRANNTDQAYADRMQRHRIICFAKKITKGMIDDKINRLALIRVRKRAKPMRDFLSENIPLTKSKYWSFDDLVKNPPVADIYCTGSDQVWNSVWNGGIEKAYFLEYVPDGGRRIAYAASIGRDCVDPLEAEVIREYLKKYSHISMRELSGVKLLEEMGIKASWVVDPTLMLSRKEWMDISEPVKIPRKKFLLAYVLNWTDLIDQSAKKLAKENNLEIIRICKNSINPLRSQGTKVVVVDKVGQLLTYFDKASCVITDSFHATAFSINFHKKVVVIPPGRFSTRLKSILTLTGMEKCMFDKSENVVLEEIDWDKVDKILASERRKAYVFLENALNC